MKKRIALLFVIGITTIGTSQNNLEWAIEPKYKNVFPFQDGRAVVCFEYGSYFVIDKDEKTIYTELEDQDLNSFSDSLALVSYSEKAYTLDSMGNKVYTQNNSKDGELAIGADYSYYIDVHGNTVIPAFKGFASNFQNGLAVIKQEYFYGCINKQGEVVIPPIYNDIDFLKEDYIKVGTYGKENEKNPQKRYSLKFGFIDKTGKMVINFTYYSARGFSEGLASVAKKRKAGYINKKGKVVIPFKFEFLNDFSEGLAGVCLANKPPKLAKMLGYGNKYINKKGELIVSRYGFINQQGKVLIPYQFEDVGSFSEGLAAAQDSTGLWGFIDKTGAWVIKPKYTYVKPFSEGLAAIEVEELWGFIDTTGRIIINPVFREARPSKEGLIGVALESTGLSGYLRNPLYKNKE